MYDDSSHHAFLSYEFTGKERDSETGLDYFGARFYASNMGRWMSPDWAAKPEAVPYSDLEDPQSLNLYGYVRNNPLSKEDPDGHNLIRWKGFCRPIKKEFPLVRPRSRRPLAFRQPATCRPEAAIVLSPL